MAVEEREPLLQNSKEYYESCSGCRVERRKESEISIYTLLATYFGFWSWRFIYAALSISSLFPFLYFMIRDFHVTEREENISYYAGYVGSALMFGRGLTSIFWGIVADRYGRKPVIIIGTLSVVVFNTLFGLSVNLWMAITTRFLLGSMNGLFGPITAYTIEFCREEHQALALSTISTAWSIGLIIGPSIGGFLSQPAEKYPNIFSKETLFGRFPYFLPCLCISLLAAGVSIFTFSLEETLHKHPEIPMEDNSYKALESATCGKCPKKASKKSILKNWQFMSTLPVYCIFSFHDMAYSEIFSLWSVSPKSLGGLGYSTEDVGEILSITGFGMLLSQFFAFPYVEKFLGPVMTMRVSSALSITLLQSYPFIALLSGLALKVLLNCASVLKNIFCTTIVTSIFILQNRTVDQDQRGAAYGISMTVMSFSKAIGPACGGALLSWSEKRQGATFLPGCQIVFFLLNVTQLMALILMFKPFLAVRDDPERKKHNKYTLVLVDHDHIKLKVERRKESEISVPFKKLFAIWVIVLASALSVSSLFPFLYFMTRDFHVTEREENISYYAGYVGSALMFGRGLTSIFWGIVADRYGLVFNTLFGLSVNFWMAITMRFLLGSMNGLFGPIKAYATEFCREEHQALALSTISTAWSIGLIIGPSIGGFLSQPAEKYPNIFSKETLFGRFPYFLPCLCISLLAAGVSIFTFSLEETLHKHPEIPMEDNSYKALESATCGECPKKASKKSILKNWQLMSTLPVYCIFSFHDMAYSEIFSLWSVSPKSLGGLGYSTEDVGEILSITGFGMLLSQFFAFPYVEKFLGPVMTMRVSSALSITLLQSYPFIALLSGLALKVLLNCASVLKNIFCMAMITSIFILQNRAVDQDQRGAANGIAMTVMSFSKAIGPACGGALLSWAEKRQGATFLPGCQIVYFLLNVTQLMGLVMTFKPFLAVRDEPKTKKEVKPELEDILQDS
ncbi:hypothetical protein V2J09_001265 [Rumex salicifolius]